MSIGKYVPDMHVHTSEIIKSESEKIRFTFIASFISSFLIHRPNSPASLMDP